MLYCVASSYWLLSLSGVHLSSFMSSNGLIAFAFSVLGSIRWSKCPVTHSPADVFLSFGMWGEGS